MTGGAAGECSTEGMRGKMGDVYTLSFHGLQCPINYCVYGVGVAKPAR